MSPTALESQRPARLIPLSPGSQAVSRDAAQLKAKQMSKQIALLGAPGPEMTVIERLLIECGLEVEYARDAEGERVTTITAHQCVRPHAPGCMILIACDGSWHQSQNFWFRSDGQAELRSNYTKIGPTSETTTLGSVIKLLAGHGVLPRSWGWEHAGRLSPLVICCDGVWYATQYAGSRVKWESLYERALIPQEYAALAGWG